MRTVRGGCCHVARLAAQDTLQRYVYALVASYVVSMYHAMPADQHTARERATHTAL
jgi:hypothetical protein